MTNPHDSGPRRDEHDDAPGDGAHGARGGDSDAPAGDGASVPADDAPAPAGGARPGGRDRPASPPVDAEPSSEPVDPGSSAAAEPVSPSGPDRVYRSGGGIGGGVLLLALIGWLGIDAVVRGQGDTPWKALATLLLLVPLVLAFTLRPAVYANHDRLRIRNPFRTITLPWASVAALRSGYSNEVVARTGAKYQLWAIPVSLRARKRAGREQARAGAGQSRPSPFGGRARGISGTFAGAAAAAGAGAGAQRGRATGGSEPARARADQTMDDLRELSEERADAPGAQGEPEVKWCYEVVGPAAAGLVLLAVLMGMG